jgi:hypothetical protein
MNAPMSKPIAPVPESNRELRSLFALSLRGLQRMFVPERGLFCHRLVQTDTRIDVEGLSPRYTLMTLLGLHRYEQLGSQSPFPVRDLTARLARAGDALENAGDLGLLLWTCAEVAPDFLDDALNNLAAASLFRKFAAAPGGPTMEVAWLLTGVAKAIAVQPARTKTLESVARDCYRLLRTNQGRSGFFGHLGVTSGAAGLLRGRVGSFADQVYPILALSAFARTFGDDEAQASARRCARAICAAQGKLGQWWWHFDAPSGRVVQRYPVYSVHQEAMGPMALFEVAGGGFDGPALKGLEWIDGRNELRQDLRDVHLGVVWRCLRFSGKAAMVGHEARFLMRPSLETVSARSLTVLRECRPYELGWLLYALCPRVVGDSSGTR